MKIDKLCKVKTLRPHYSFDFQGAFWICSTLILVVLYG